MNKKFLIPISGLLIILFIFLIGYIIDDGAKNGLASTGKLALSGTIEAKEVDVASKIPGKIVELGIEEGKVVQKGDLLLQVDKKDLEIKRLQAEAAVKGAKAQLDKAVRGARSQQIAQAKAAVEQAEAQVKLLENKYNRLYPLYEAEALPLDQLDEVETKLQVARLQAEQAHEQLGLVLEGAQAEDIMALESQYELAQAKLKEVVALIEDTTVTAPCNGTITMLAVEEGEFVNTGMPIISITDYSDAWVRMDIYETQLAQIKVGGKVTIKSRTYFDKEFSGEVLTINKNPDFAVKKTTDELNDKDIMSYSVKVKILDNQELLLPGMRVDVNIGSENSDAE